MLVSMLKKIGLMFSLNGSRWKQGSEKPMQNQNGKGPNEGPPDLEQLWRDFNARIGRWFGNKGDGGGGGFKPNMRGVGIGFSVIVVLAALLWMASGVFIVDKGQTAVVSTFGKYNHTASSGFNWHWPYPIENSEIVNTSEVVPVEVGLSGSKDKQAPDALVITNDKNIVDVQFSVQYKINDAYKWIFNNREKQSTIRQVAEAAIREVVGKNKMDFVLYDGHEQVAKGVGHLMQQILDQYNMGVEIASVTIQDVQAPEQVQAAFDDVAKAGRDRERKKNDSQVYASSLTANAAIDAARLKEQSQNYSSSVIAHAEGDAERFKSVLAEYQKAPGVTRDRMYLETMQQIFASTTKVMVDSKSGNNMIYLPLDKLIAQSAGDSSIKPSITPPPAATADVTVTPPAPPPSTTDSTQGLDPLHTRDLRSRDSRDRETR